MKTRSISLLVALTVSMATLASAQPRPPDDHDDHHEQRGPDRRHAPPPRVAEQRHDGERGAGPDHAFYRGGRLPVEYRNRQYVVDDWRGHHLSAPPRGYHWVQTGADYVLAAIATGVIAQVLLDH